MKVVFDTNVVVAGIVAEGLCREILEVHLPEHEAVLSEILWVELVATLRRKFALSPQELPILNLYRQHAEWCTPAALEQNVCRDPDDDWVIATAVIAKAEAIVTGDADLLTRGRYRRTEIISPREFVRRQPRTRRR